MISQTEAYNRGYASGKRNAASIRQQIEATFQTWKAGFPSSAHLDYEQELLRLDRDRLDNPPSLARFPETKGCADIAMAERRGFAEGSGGGPLEVAFKYNQLYFYAMRLSTRYIGRGLDPAECTAVFMRESTEGGPLYGRNLDSAYSPEVDVRPPRRGPDDVRRLWWKGVSCWLMCDEEPENTFPINAWDMLPADCRKLPDVIEFVSRYCEFWWPCNGIVVDEELNCAAFEKTARRIAWRHTDNGTAAVTACAQVIPEMKKFREERLKLSLELRDYQDNNLPDRDYWSGAEKRYRRLLGMVDDAARRGPSLQDMISIMTDRAAGHDRICLAGESCHPAIPEGAGEWTLRSRSVVLHGPNRRTMFWSVNGKNACYLSKPYLIPGEGVAVKPEWLVGTQPLPPADGPDDELEPYRQYEFDYPDIYPQ